MEVQTSGDVKQGGAPQEALRQGMFGGVSASLGLCAQLCSVCMDLSNLLCAAAHLCIHHRRPASKLLPTVKVISPRPHGDGQLPLKRARTASPTPQEGQPAEAGQRSGSQEPEAAAGRSGPAGAGAGKAAGAGARGEAPAGSGAGAAGGSEADNDSTQAKAGLHGLLAYGSSNSGSGADSDDGEEVGTGAGPKQGTGAGKAGTGTGSKAQPPVKPKVALPSAAELFAADEQPKDKEQTQQDDQESEGSIDST